MLPRLRKAFPRAKLLIRLDSGFAHPELFDYFEEQGLDYLVGLPGNSRLNTEAEPLMSEVRAELESKGEATSRYGQFKYMAKKNWSHERRGIFKAEVTTLKDSEPNDNQRYVVTNLKSSPCSTYKRYCKRGDSENRIKELKNDLHIDRTSCTKLMANQVRVLMTAAAYVLMQELRLKASHTSCARAQVGTLRLRLLKLCAWVESSVRRIIIHKPIKSPFADDWYRIALSVGAIAT